jgi:hypothetical protein
MATEMPADPERAEWLAHTAADLLIAAVDRDEETTAALLCEIVERYDLGGVHSLCFMLASVVHKLAFPKFARGDGTLSGDFLAIWQLPGCDENPAAMWAARFVAAYINGDGANTSALFFGGLPDARNHVAGVCALIIMASDLARTTQEQTRTGGEASL